MGGCIRPTHHNVSLKQKNYEKMPLFLFFPVSRCHRNAALTWRTLWAWRTHQTYKEHVFSFSNTTIRKQTNCFQFAQQHLQPNRCLMDWDLPATRRICITGILKTRTTNLENLVLVTLRKCFPLK